jgi:hypothetical protein
MKAIYRAAKVPFPELDTTGAVSDAAKAARRAKILETSKTILQRADKRKEKE